MSHAYPVVTHRSDSWSNYQLHVPSKDVAELERQLDELLAKDAALVEHGEVSAHLARYGLCIAQPGDMRFCCYLQLEGWLRRKLFWVAPLVEV